MVRLDIDRLQSFVTAADAGSLTAAAQRLNRSQSALSEQNRKLEDAAGAPLFMRGKAGVRTTAAGERLLTRARAILSLHDSALDEMRGVSLSGELRLAITDYFRPSAIARVLKRLRSSHPSLRLQVSIQKSASIEESSVSYDLGLFLRLRDSIRDRGTSVLCREPLSWVTAANFVHEEGPLPLVALPATCTMHTLAMDRLNRQGVPTYIAHSTSGVAGLQSAVLAGLGIACLNASSIPEGAWRYDGPIVLPDLPLGEFCLTPRRRGEAPIVDNVRNILLKRWSEPF